MPHLPRSVALLGAAAVAGSSAWAGASGAAEPVVIRPPASVTTEHERSSLVEASAVWFLAPHEGENRRDVWLDVKENADGPALVWARLSRCSNTSGAQRCVTDTIYSGVEDEALVWDGRTYRVDTVLDAGCSVGVAFATSGGPAPHRADTPSEIEPSETGVAVVSSGSAWEQRQATISGTVCDWLEGETVQNRSGVVWVRNDDRTTTRVELAPDDGPRPGTG